MTQVNTHHRPFSPIVGLILYVSIISCIGCEDLPTEGDSQERIGINTLREPFHKSDNSCGPFPSYYFEYLDDTKCKKIRPTHRDREFQCPIETSDELISAGSYLSADIPQAQIDVDTRTLTPMLPIDASITLILIRRVNGVPYFRYLSNGRHDEIVETWSSSKFLGVMNASESLRYYSGMKLGLDASVDGIPVGDLVTVVHNYDERLYTSNGLMSWFHDVGGRFFANQLIHLRWLNRPDQEVFGANYGSRSPKLGFTFERDDQTVEIEPDQGWIKSNLLSTFTLAEALKRLVMYRETPNTQLEYSTWEDIKVLLYGAQNSVWYDQKTPQGMESDVSIYMQSAVDIDQIEVNTQGQWRIFSKLGLGSSRGGEFVHTDYACLPVFDQTGQPIVDGGAELVISIHLPAHDDYVKSDTLLADVYKDVVRGVLSGRIR